MFLNWRGPSRFLSRGADFKCSQPLHFLEVFFEPSATPPPRNLRRQNFFSPFNFYMPRISKYPSAIQDLIADGLHSGPDTRNPCKPSTTGLVIQRGALFTSWRLLKISPRKSSIPCRDAVPTGFWDFFWRLRATSYPSRSMRRLKRRCRMSWR